MLLKPHSVSKVIACSCSRRWGSNTTPDLSLTQLSTSFQNLHVFGLSSTRWPPTRHGTDCGTLRSLHAAASIPIAYGLAAAAAGSVQEHIPRVAVSAAAAPSAAALRAAPPLQSMKRDREGFCCKGSLWYQQQRSWIWCFCTLPVVSGPSHVSLMHKPARNCCHCRNCMSEGPRERAGQKQLRGRF